MPSCCPSKPHKLGFTAVLPVPDFGVGIFFSVVSVILAQISGEHSPNAQLKSITFCENHMQSVFFLIFCFVFCFGGAFLNIIGSI